jgi:hypothetical protein
VSSISHPQRWQKRPNRRNAFDKETKESRANEAFPEVRHFSFAIDREALLSESVRLTLRAARKSRKESSVRLDNSPISNISAGLAGNRLKGFLSCNGTGAPDIELLGKLLAKEISRDEFARRDLLYHGRYGRWTRQEHFAGAAEKS